MERINLSEYVDLILFLQDQKRIRKSKTNNDLFLYVKELIDLLDAVEMGEELKFLEGHLQEYLNRISRDNKSYFNQVNYDDLKKVNNVVFEFLFFFEKKIQNKYFYLPNYKLEENFDQKFENLLEKGVGVFKDLNYNFMINLNYAKEAFSFGLFNSAAIHLSIAVKIYNEFLYSKIVKILNDESKPGWFNIIEELNELKSEVYIPDDLINSLHEIRKDNRNATLHENKMFELEDTMELIDKCFGSILLMKEVLIKNAVPDNLDEIIDVTKI